MEPMGTSFLFAVNVLYILDKVAGLNSLNCSFGELEACLYQYQLMDHNGLTWERTEGKIGHGRLPDLEASPFGEYVYIAGTTNTNAHDHWTDLTSPKFTFDGDGCLSFLYQDNWCDSYYAPQQKSFKVFLKPSDDGDHILLREYLCVQSTKWLNEQISAVTRPGVYNLVFSALQHKYSSDIIAVDHVQYTSQSCAVQTSDSFASGDCDFEGTDFCGYSTYNRGAHPALRWMTARREMLNKGAGNQGAPEGHLAIVTWEDVGTFYPSAQYISLISPMITVRDAGCLLVTYYRGRSSHPHRQTNILSVRKADRADTYLPTKSQLLMDLPTTLKDTWLQKHIELPTGTYVIIFEASVRHPIWREPRDVIGLGNIEIHQESCYGIERKQSPCSTELSPCTRGQCIAKGKKHFVCKCDVGVYGRRCEFGNGPLGHTVENKTITVDNKSSTHSWQVTVSWLTLCTTAVLVNNIL